MDWSKLPDIFAVASLACAFSSISRQDRTPAQSLWLGGWILIVIHFMGFMIMGLPGIMGLAGLISGLVSLIAAGVFFMWATVPYETTISCRRMASAALLTMCIYAVLASLPAVPAWTFDVTAVLIALAPLTVAVAYIRYEQHTLRWITVVLQFLLGVTLLILGHIPGGNPDLGMNAIFFTVYIGCCLYFCYAHRRGTAGSIITICGFFAWAMVFIVAPLLDHFLPNYHLESEVWNLPKYVVAVGMLLLLLEKQIERSQYLALHDDLTSLANRRLFQDRLTSAIERAKRAATSIALLQVDLDRFKEVNDTFGHHVGDQLLQQVSTLLASRVRRSDTVARTGGDEFSLILEEPSRREDAELVAMSLSQILAEPFELSGHRIRIGASIGIAVYPTDAQDAEALCVEADMRMYGVKTRRREVVRQPVRTAPIVRDQGSLVS